ncbi:tachykinin-like peptide [Discoglossus pictus]
MEFNEDGYYPYREQIQTDLEDPTFERFLLRLVRRPLPGDFVASMGKRTNEFKRTSPKRHGSFIGLMGKRALSSESEERNIDLDFERRRK